MEFLLWLAIFVLLDGLDMFDGMLLKNTEIQEIYVPILQDSFIKFTILGSNIML